MCGNSARTDLGGGRSAMTVPTALHFEFFSSLTPLRTCDAGRRHGLAPKQDQGHESPVCRKV